jgi:retron-type reverse transcriptase
LLRLVKLFDTQSVSFVSVTQQFNTTSSMGRLTLNVLMSFAQFEREVTGERIRDKIAASKKRGMWMGGNVPSGYDASERKLVVNPAEAETVRRIFALYRELGSVRRVKEEADRLGIRTKCIAMTIDDARAYLREHWPNIRSHLLSGTYQPQPVKRVEIPKPDGGIRRLGVPCVVDRLIQQALLQVLQERWDPTFSEHSYGFRPGRSAHQAVAQAQRYVAEGHGVVVDLDLE